MAQVRQLQKQEKSRDRVKDSVSTSPFNDNVFTRTESSSMASVRSDTNSPAAPIERSQLNLSPGTTEVVETFSENTLPPNNCSQHSCQPAADLSFSDRVGRASMSSVKHVSTGTARKANESNESNLQSGFNEMAEPSLNSSVSASLADQLFTPSTKKEVNIAMKNKDLPRGGSAKSTFGFDVFSNRGERVIAPSISERSACLDSQSHVDLSSIDKSGSLVYLQHSAISSLRLCTEHPPGNLVIRILPVNGGESSTFEAVGQVTPISLSI
ncbi:hypothetical protein EB796_020993 [Bugula neritina]|uniref:Uncharacterized protein n=1 Tax=Bugula neritina TaxID=10212 RepID=A0A7J7J4W1_BUGNE|nr:hypothetical protein EB796_020993 [Bugula neritina]